MNGKKEVMKLYTTRNKEDMKKLEISPEEHARLSIQTQANAEYICAKFMEKLFIANHGVPVDFEYVHARLGCIGAGEFCGEYCMLEPYLKGEILC